MFRSSGVSRTSIKLKIKSSLYDHVSKYSAAAHHETLILQSGVVGASPPHPFPWCQKSTVCYIILQLLLLLLLLQLLSLLLLLLLPLLLLRVMLLLHPLPRPSPMNIAVTPTPLKQVPVHRKFTRAIKTLHKIKLTTGGAAHVVCSIGNLQHRNSNISDTCSITVDATSTSTASVATTTAAAAKDLPYVQRTSQTASKLQAASCIIPHSLFIVFISFSD